MVVKTKDMLNPPEAVPVRVGLGQARRAFSVVCKMVRGRLILKGL
jgi:hypothetical protein